jgi:hypothetical protein
VTGKDAELIDEVCTGKTRSVMLWLHDANNIVLSWLDALK